MAKSKLAGVFVVLLALTLFFGGMLSYRLLAGTSVHALGGTSAAPQAALRSESVGIQGKVDIQVYSSSGQLLTSWKGHNSLTPIAINAIAGCLSGATTTPLAIGSCSGAVGSCVIGGPCKGWVVAIDISDVAGDSPLTAATNTVLPLGCTPASFSATLCTGWQSTATIGIAASGAYNQAQGLYVESAGVQYEPFDTVSISPSLSLNAGDRAVVTITFTVS
jgi:hypothetical protein